jgi:hypothetical protein
MARVTTRPKARLKARLKKAPLTLMSLGFSTAEQKVLALLLAAPTQAFTPRVMASKLKGLRGLGGIEGITKILADLQMLGMVDFVDNHRAARLREDSPSVRVLKVFHSICEFEGLRECLEPLSSCGILYRRVVANSARHAYEEAGLRPAAQSYDLFVVSEMVEDVKRAAGRHPLGKTVALKVWTPELYAEIDRQDLPLRQQLKEGILLWGGAW